MGKVLHVNRSGYFTTCIFEPSIPPIPSGVGRATLFPSIKDVMAIWWRVREWEARCLGGTLNDGFDDTVVGDSGWQTFWTSPLGKEENLVCYNPNIIPESYAYGDILNVPYTYLGNNLTTTAHFSIGSYWPYWQGNEDNVYVFVESAILGQQAQPGLGNITGQCSLTLPRPEINQPDYEVTWPLYNESFYLSGNLSLAMRPKKWWKYENIYDENTGKYDLQA